MESALAMIMAGGRETRMDILCQHRAKPMLPFAGSFRVIDFTLSNCLHSQIRDIVTLTDYQRSNIASYLGRWALVNNMNGRVHIETANKAHLGSADAVYQSLEYLKKDDSQYILVLAGDHVYKMDYRDMLAFHQKMNADVTVGVVEAPVEEAHRFGIVTTDIDGRIIDFIEKPEIPQSNLVSMGIYVFNKEPLIEMLIEDARQANSRHDFGHGILPGMLNRFNVFSYEFDSYWRDIGNPIAYYQANMEMLSTQTSFSLNGKQAIYTGYKNLPSLIEHRNSSIRNSLISPGCVIKGRVENSVLSPNVWVDKEAEIRDSIIMANSYVGYNSLVEHCIIDEDVKVGRYCHLRGESTSLNDKYPVTLVGKGVTIPSYTVVGSGCKIPPYTDRTGFMEKTYSLNSMLLSV